MTAPVVSVVICTRNRAPLLRRALASVVGQSLPRHLYEIVVVDISTASPKVKTRISVGSQPTRLVLSRDGSFALEMTTDGMFRGWADASGARSVAIYADAP